jgi:hypothetical protein
MAELTVQQIARTGLEATYAAAAGGGDEFDNDGRTFFHIINANGSDRTATFVTSVTVDGLAVGDVAVVVTAGEERMVGPFPPSIFNDTDGHVNVTYSAVTDVTVAAIRLP